MGFRDKLLDLKRRLSDRKMYSIVITVIALISIGGIYQYKRASNLRQELDNQYNRSFFDLVGYVNNVETLMAKSLITSTPTKTAGILQEAWRQSNLAQTNLGQLPVSQPVLANTSKFLTQLGDLTYSLNNQNMSGKYYTDEQYKTIENLHGYSVSLGNSLNELQNQITTGRIKWGQLSDKGTPLFSKTSNKLPAEQFAVVDKNFQEYPTLIYDGPFSEHMTSSQPKGLTGDVINAEQGKEIIKTFFGPDRVSEINDLGKNDNTSIKTISYTVKLKNMPEKSDINIELTQKGGHVLWMLYNRPVEKSVINIDKAKEFGGKFLASRGFVNMKDTYYLKEDNIATINYAFDQDNVTVYCDLIKVKIALDTGEIVGFESKGYLDSHSIRNIPKAKISKEKAKSLINSRVQVLSSGLAIIPTEYKTEIITYEFKGKLNNQDFLVYVNTETGKEENILMIVNTPNGVLTM